MDRRRSVPSPLAKRVRKTASLLLEHLSRELTKIIEGEPPYDIFVRWKPPVSAGHWLGAGHR